MNVFQVESELSGNVPTARYLCTKQTLLLAFPPLASGGNRGFCVARRRNARVMSTIVIRRVRARIRIMMIGMVLATVVAALAADVLGGVIIPGSAMIAHVPIIPIVSLGEITIASAIIAVAARIMVARGALVPIAISTPVVPVFVPAAVQTVVLMVPPALVQAVIFVIPVTVAEAVFTVAITKTVVAIAIGLITS
jgi:hypothetical protein